MCWHVCARVILSDLVARAGYTAGFKSAGGVKNRGKWFLPLILAQLALLVLSIVTGLTVAGIQVPLLG
jgi:hypothetical protein